MRRLIAIICAGALAMGVVGATAANGDSNRNAFRANLSGYQETPAISSSASGDLALSVNPAGTQITYTLTYSALQGGNAFAAHIHLGQAGVAGAVVIFLCGGGGKPACPATGGPVSGVINPSDVIGVPAQGITAGDLGAVLKALRSGVTYANVHSVGFPGGEICCQIPGHGNNGGNGGGDGDD